MLSHKDLSRLISQHWNGPGGTPRVEVDGMRDGRLNSTATVIMHPRGVSYHIMLTRADLELPEADFMTRVLKPALSNLAKIVDG